MYYLVYLIGFIVTIVQKEKRTFTLFFLGVLFLLAFFRYGVGADYFAYSFLFNRLNDSPIDEFLYGKDPHEILFRLIGSSIKYFGLSYQVYLGLFVFITLYYVYKLSDKYSSKPVFSLLLYYSIFYFVWTFSGLRQGATLAIGSYYLIETLENNKNIKFFLIVATLMLIHISSFTLVVLFILNKINWTKKNIIIFAGLSIIISLWPLKDFILLISDYIPIFNRVYPYLNNSAKIYDFSYLVRLVMLILGVYFYDIFQENKKDSYIINTFIIGLSMFFFSSFSVLIASRISIYGYFMVILVIPKVMKYMNNFLKKSIVVILIFIGSFSYFNKEVLTMRKQSKMEVSGIFVPYTNTLIDSEIEFKSRYIDK